MYAIHDTFENDQPAGVFETYKKTGDFLGLSLNAVYYAIKRDSLMKNRYTAEKIEDDIND